MIIWGKKSLGHCYALVSVLYLVYFFLSGQMEDRLNRRQHTYISFVAHRRLEGLALAFVVVV